MDRQADFRFHRGDIDYPVAWVLLTFLGLFGIHRFYMGKWFTGIVYLLTGGIFGIGYPYDLWTLNNQVSLINSRSRCGTQRSDPLIWDSFPLTDRSSPPMLPAVQKGRFNGNGRPQAAAARDGRWPYAGRRICQGQSSTMEVRIR